MITFPPIVRIENVDLQGTFADRLVDILMLGALLGGHHLRSRYRDDE